MQTDHRESARVRWTRAVLVVTGLAFGVLRAPAHALDVHYVPGDFGTLQAAIDAATPGDTIVLDGGTHLYTEIDKALTIVGRASAPPFLTVDSSVSLPGGGWTQYPPLLIGSTATLVTLVGVQVGGGTWGGSSPTNVPGIVAEGPDLQLRIFHSGVEAPVWAGVDGAATLTGAAIAGYNLSRLTAVDSSFQAAGHKNSGIWGNVFINPGVPGVDLSGVATSTILDSTFIGGDSIDPAYFFTDVMEQPESCDDLQGGQGGPGLRSDGNVRIANVLSVGGKGAFAIFQGPTVPPDFPCQLPDGEPYDVEALTSLDDGATLTGSGPAIENSGWSLHWFVEAPSILAIGPALLEPLQHPAGLLFMDPDKLILRPVPSIGPGSKTFAIGDLDEQLYGQVLGFQLYSPQQGLSRPVLAAVQPD